MVVVQVAVPKPLRRIFDYAAISTSELRAGMRVRVPFAGAQVVGVVIDVRDKSPFALKTIEEVLDETPILSADLVDLAAWLASYYHHPIGEVYATMLPAKARQGAPAAHLDDVTWQAVDDVAALDALQRAPQQRLAYQRLQELGGVADSNLKALGLARRLLYALQGRGLARRAVLPPCYRAPEAGAELQPTAAQAAAIEAISASLDSAVTHLLDGVTGSGKTEVYLRVIAEVLRRGRQALVLVPEIALTPQTTARFQERFGAAATLHSGVSDAQRFDIWCKCANGTHKVLIGTRSAVFTPFADLGVIVVDEEHDGSFKQGDGLRYSARDVAVKRGRALAIPVVLGSATPSLESLQNVSRGRYRHATLKHRAGGASMPAFRLLDVRGQHMDRGLCERLHEAVARHLQADGQVLVFLNRRGYAPALLCTRCAWRAQCDHCDAKLTYHRVPRQLRCHHCGSRRAAPQHCPSCGHDELIPVGTGTQRAEEALAERYPNVPLYRIDRDTTRSARRLAADLAAVQAGSPAILVGTQMLAKGHHFPNVTLVAILDADNGFLSADFRGPERTAQLIIQVAGRAGRAMRPGEVCIQTFDPTNPNLTELIRTGYHGFARTERDVRAAAGMPPFAALALIRAESEDEARAAALLSTVREVLQGDEVEVLGPAAAPIARRADRYRCQLLALASRRNDLRQALARLEEAAPRAAGVRWAIDVDPVDTL